MIDTPHWAIFAALGASAADVKEAGAVLVFDVISSQLSNSIRLAYSNADHMSDLPKKMRLFFVLFSIPY